MIQKILWNKISEIVFTNKTNSTEAYIEKYRIIKQRQLALGKYPFIFKKTTKARGKLDLYDRRDALMNIKTDFTMNNILGQSENI